jgi:hypothetical protein
MAPLATPRNVIAAITGDPSMTPLVPGLRSAKSITPLANRNTSATSPTASFAPIAAKSRETANDGSPMDSTSDVSSVASRDASRYHAQLQFRTVAVVDFDSAGAHQMRHSMLECVE